MGRQPTPEHVKQKVVELLKAPEHYSYRDLANIVTNNIYPISRQKVWEINSEFGVRKTLNRKERNERKNCLSLTLNLEEKTLANIEKIKGQKSRSVVINELLKNWLNRHSKESTVSKYCEWQTSHNRRKDSRIKYVSPRKKSIFIDKNLLAKLIEIQFTLNKLENSNLDYDFFVQKVREKSKMSLNDWLYTLEQQGNLKKHRPRTSIAQIINFILASGL